VLFLAYSLQTKRGREGYRKEERKGEQKEERKEERKEGKKERREEGKEERKEEPTFASTPELLVLSGFSVL
jgi:hypothetical protein